MIETWSVGLIVKVSKVFEWTLIYPEEKKDVPFAPSYIIFFIVKIKVLITILD